jgi:hypothetical protein
MHAVVVPNICTQCGPISDVNVCDIHDMQPNDMSHFHAGKKPIVMWVS